MMEGDQAGDTGGTAQGCPLSPISSNIMLDDLDRELWQLLHSLQPISNSQCDGRNS
jgi:retron-type reverse transcriptase